MIYEWNLFFLLRFLNLLYLIILKMYRYVMLLNVPLGEGGGIVIHKVTLHVRTCTAPPPPPPPPPAIQPFSSQQFRTPPPSLSSLTSTCSPTHTAIQLYDTCGGGSHEDRELLGTQMAIWAQESKKSSCT